MSVTFSFISYTLFAIILISLINFYLLRKIALPETFKNVLTFALLFVLCNSIHSFYVEIVYGDTAWSRKTIPSVLLYGPLYYYGILSLKKENFSKPLMALHALPFTVFCVYFFSVYLGLISYSKYAVKSLYAISAISFVFYALLTIIAGKGMLKNKLQYKLLVFVFGRVLLLFIAFLFIIAIFSDRITNNIVAVNLLRMLIYFCLLGYVYIIFIFIVKQLLIDESSFNKIQPNLLNIDLELNKNSRYEKSSLTEEQLIFYKQQLHNAMLNEKLYLNPLLSLSGLSAFLKLPNHHLTQVLSMQINQTFYQYINGLRIAYACQLLKQDVTINFEELAEKSGFNSKPSFNRQFKLIMKCTPSVYKIKMQGNFG